MEKNETARGDRGCVACMPAAVREFAAGCVKKSHPRSFLIPVLHRLQSEVGYLKREHMEEVGKILEVPYMEILGVATFYHYFTLEPRGKHTVSVCMGTACHVKGASEVLERIEKLLGISHGQTSVDGLFTIATARCVGMCAMAPVLTVGEKVYGNVKKEDVEEILREHGYEGGA
jgi:NADH:ubiquinone oxidoreductase subunit E